MASPASDPFFIIIRAPNGEVREVPLEEAAIVIGRDESADVRVDDKKVSRRHAAFKVSDGEAWVEDLGSQNGVKLNNKRIPRRSKFVVGDVVRVGGYQVTLKPRPSGGARASSSSGSSTSAGAGGGAGETREGRMYDSEVGEGGTRTAGVVPRPRGNSAASASGPQSGGPSASSSEGKPKPTLIGLDPPCEGKRFALQIGENIVGRLEDCQIPILDGSVSRQHARVVLARGRITVTDLGASNGTFVNDKRVDMSDVADGDLVKFGSVCFRLEVPDPTRRRREGNDGATRTAPEARSKRNPTVWIGLMGVLTAISAALVFVLYKPRRGAPLFSRPPVAGEPVAAPDDAGAEPLAANPDPTTPVTPPKPDPAATPPKPDPAATPPKPDPAATPPKPDPAPPPKPVPLPPTTETGTAVATRIAPAPTTSIAAALPSNLPTVDVLFDFDGFVAEKLKSAETLEKSGAAVEVRRVLVELLDKDPINQDARLMLKRLAQAEAAKRALADGDAAAKEGQGLKALELWGSIPAEAKEAKDAKARIDQLRPTVVAEELAKAEEEIKNQKTWKRAHDRLRRVLEVDWSSERAREEIRALERQMRGKQIRFTAYVPPRTESKPEAVGRPATASGQKEGLSKAFGGDKGLERIGELYLAGDLGGATREADAVQANKKSSPERKQKAKDISAAMVKIKAKVQRVKSELSNDPAVAWAHLIELEKIEQSFLPGDLRSFLRNELEQSIAEAYAGRGNALLEQDHLEEAFQQWDSAFKLDPANARALAGLKKLEERAQKLGQEAELASQRGERDVCLRWKRITKITRNDSEIHKKARERIRAASCNG